MQELSVGRDPLSFLSRLLSGSSSPSADLYMGWSCCEWIELGIIDQLAPTVFRYRDTLIVFRHDAGVSISRDIRRIILVLDDDILAAVQDAALPAAYRAKLALLEARAEKRLIPASDVVVCASDALESAIIERYPGVRTTRMDPCWPDPRQPEFRKSTEVSMAFLAGQSHAGDFIRFKPVLRKLLDKHSNLRVTLSKNLPVPHSWSQDLRVETVPALNWSAYRKWMKSQSFDIGIYPISDAGMNAARSSNKLAEYAQFGAAIVAPDTWSAGREAANQSRCVVVADNPDSWEESLSELIESPSLAASIARANRQALLEEMGLGAQKELWAELIGLPDLGLTQAAE